MIILYNKNIVFTGSRNKGGLWYVDPLESTNYSNISIKAIKILPSASYHNCTTCNSMSSSMHSVNYTVTFPATHVINILGPCRIIKDRIAFDRGAFGVCAILTLCSAINKQSVASLPGELTSNQVRKHLNFPKPMHQGYLSQEFQAILSTQTLPASEYLADRSPEKIAQISNLIFASCFQATGEFYGDPTGPFVV